MYCYFSACKLPSLINFAAVGTMCLTCDQASATNQCPTVLMSWISGRGAPGVEEFLLRVSGKSLGGIRMVPVAVPRMAGALSLSGALMREAGGGEAA